MKSKDWLNRQKRDFYVKKAKKQGYLSRASYKLIEIDNKFNILKKSKKIFEFGAAPGGWCQVALDINPNIHITAIDLLELKINHPQIKFYKENFLNFNYDKQENKYDLILSDIAPNTTGHQSTDHLRISSMLFDIINKFDKLMIKNGVFVTKIWKGSEEKDLINILQNRFSEVSYFKPQSSRKDSAEIFIVAKKFKN
ncbi:RlmE family RNA methyltransferase [Pelagibacterales bacterium SAG-MED31]|nr:RlmE family RNA methyltransferase [Pelagibacterales bacterium SAG-MED31]